MPPAGWYVATAAHWGASILGAVTSVGTAFPLFAVAFGASCTFAALGWRIMDTVHASHDRLLHTHGLEMSAVVTG